MLTLALLAVRLLLALVFIAAAVGKLRDRPAFAETLVQFGAPRTAAAPLSILIPAVELGLAPALLTTGTAPQAALLALLLLLLFPGAIAVHRENVEKYKDKKFPSKPVGIADMS